MKFIDSSKIIVRSGAGGRGNVSFARGPCQPKLGPDGGDGGFGGSVYFLGESGLNTLQTLRFSRIFQAKNGAKGGTNNKTGRDGADIVIKVPLGTIAIDSENERVIAEIVEHGQKVLVAKGGKRGIGNSRFVSSTHQAPEEFTSGGPSVELKLRLELKVLADVGLAGFPNAGKSTLVSRISAARPKIADYPFTTLTPQLGVVSLESNDSGWGDTFVMADIPGLIEGASQGKGLGFEFLKHLERTKIVAFVLDAFTDEELPPQVAFEKLRDELVTYNMDFEKKRFVIVLSKMDLMIDESQLKPMVEYFEQMGYPVFTISAVTGQGIDNLKRELFKIVSSENQKNQAAQPLPFPYAPHLPKLSDFELQPSKPHLS